MRGHTESATPSRVDLNEADPELLSSMLPGIGPVLAERIVAFRQGQGPFSDPSELARVPGIGPRLASLLVERLSVTPPMASMSSAPPEEAPGISWGEEALAWAPPTNAAEAPTPDPRADPPATPDPLADAAAAAAEEAPVPPEPTAHAGADDSTAVPPRTERFSMFAESGLVPDLELPPKKVAFLAHGRPTATTDSQPSPSSQPQGGETREPRESTSLAEGGVRVTTLRPEATAAAPPPSPSSLRPSARTPSQRPQPFVAPRADDVAPRKSLSEDVDPMTVAAEAVPAPSLPRPSARSRRVATALTALLGVLLGASFARQSERKAAGVTQASVDHVTHEVRALRADEDRAHEEMTRQAAELARQASDLEATRAALAATVEAQKVAEAKVEARSAHIAQDVTDLRRAQARADARVFKLDEAIRLIDWATTTGFVRQVVSDAPGKPAVSSAPRAH